MSILIAEDNDVTSQLMQLNLEKLGYASIVAKNGSEAIEKLKASNDIRLVITDILMPDMDGLTLFQAIKSTPSFQNTPVIICSSLSDAPSIKKAASLGCKHYLLKPFSLKNLKEKSPKRSVQRKESSKTKRRLSESTDSKKVLSML